MNELKRLEEELKERQWTALLAGIFMVILGIALIFMSVNFYAEKSMNWEGKYKAALNFIKKDLPEGQENEIIKTIQDLIEVDARSN